MMSENAPPDQTRLTTNANETNAESTIVGEPASTNGGTRSPTWFNNRYGNVTGTTHRDFAGNTPNIGGILGLHSENAINPNILTTSDNIMMTSPRW